MHSKTEMAAHVGKPFQLKFEIWIHMNLVVGTPPKYMRCFVWKYSGNFTFSSLRKNSVSTAQKGSSLATFMVCGNQQGINCTADTEQDPNDAAGHTHQMTCKKYSQRQ